MPALPQAVLHAKLRAALPRGTSFSTADDIHPAIAKAPSLGAIRVYLWTLTTVDTALRDPDEYKIQLILPGQSRGEWGELELDGPHTTFLLGYSPDFGVFVAWEAPLHPRFKFSSTVQVKEHLLEEAVQVGWSVAPPRRVREGFEVRVAVTPGNLFRYMRIAQRADNAGYSGDRREAYVAASMARGDGVELPNDAPALKLLTKRVRHRLIIERASRDAKFSPLVKRQYGHACAVCHTQLDVVDGAHIIPVSEDGSEDEIWNGVCLCANHHRLFDSYAFVITPELRVMVDDSVVQFLTESGRSQGVDELLQQFDSTEIIRPLFFGSDSSSRKKMREALAWRQRIAALDA